MDDQIKHTTGALVAGSASKSTYAGSAMAVGGWLMSSEAAVLIGVVLGILGFVVNLIFKVREDARQEAIHKLQIAELKAASQVEVVENTVLSRLLKKNADNTKLTIIYLARPWWDIGANIIRWALPQSRFKWSLTNHCVVLDGDYVIHSMMFKGVIRERAAEVLARYSTQIGCIYDVSNAQAGIDWARDQVGKPYDWEGALGIALHPDRNWQRDDSWFCFEFAAASLREAGLDVFEKVGHITPTTLMLLKHETI